jgi:mannose-6-phosphate isomerase-like protein (cupin superfamily)
MRKHEIRSEVDGSLLHVIIRAEDFPGAREDISAAHEALQLSVIATPKWTTYQAHRHIPKKTPSEHVTQETWIVVRGRVSVSHDDIDGTLLEVSILESGDCTITYAGGHGYQILTDDARVYELKTGPYAGSAALDKEYI